MRKKEEERQNINNIGRGDSDGKILAVIDDEVRSLGHHGNKLNQLHQGQRGLPPDGKGFSGFGDLGVHANEVVGVHAGVDEPIENDGQINITVVKDVCVEPVE